MNGTILTNPMRNKIRIRDLVRIRTDLRQNLFGFWIVTMCILPALQSLGGKNGLIVGVSIAVFAQAILVCQIVATSWGWRRTLQATAMVVCIGLVAEAIGTSTGFPFGGYQYTSVLQPQILGVPLVVAFAWWILIPSAWVVAGRIVGMKNLALFALTSSLALTAWDLMVDPLMVKWEFWKWYSPEGYFGVPIRNFLGWILVASAMTWMVRPTQLEIRPLVLIYALTCYFLTTAQLFVWVQPGPAIVGSLAMAGLLGAPFISKNVRLPALSANDTRAHTGQLKTGE